MGYYESGVVTFDGLHADTSALVILRALRALGNDPRTDRVRRTRGWCKDMLATLRKARKNRPSWGTIEDGCLPVVVRCYGNFAWSDMWHLTEHLARQLHLLDRRYSGEWVTLVTWAEDRNKPKVRHEYFPGSERWQYD